MFENSNLIVTAWDNDLLVGVSLLLQIGFGVVTWPTLQVNPDYQKAGIGRKLLN